MSDQLGSSKSGAVDQLNGNNAGSDKAKPLLIGDENNSSSSISIDDEDDSDKASLVAPTIDEMLSKIDETTLANLDKPMMVRKYQHEDCSTPEWFEHSKHVFIFSLSGKPIYSRYGDEVQLNTFMATLSAMSSFVESQKDELRYINAGAFKFVFLHRDPLCLVSIYNTSEPPQIVSAQLEYMHALVVSMLTQTNMKAVFDAKYDLRDLLGGTDKFLDNLMKTIDNDTSILLNSVNCLRLNYNTRNEITTIIHNNRHESVLFALLVAGNKLVSFVKQKKYSLKPQDIHIVMNFVSSTSSFRESETWTPICLPNFNDAGFLHLYICYIMPDVCLLLFSAQAEAFYHLSSSKDAIVKELESRNLLEELSKAVQNHGYSVEATGVPYLLHFIQNETVMVAVASSHELYATFSPLESKQNVFDSFSQLLQWIKDNESNIYNPFLKILKD
ncbi:DUF254 family protein [Heterostelium album PN500]|uniref:DUF254 family protein n=1 Tax=Heterostelium pallidum (strain ATCC 26659 / Pp 5 / PN500) TaxID=670386 RepID=D3B1L8_HETP5|nr:DUF254 family protein [Heterostelium album PN500]EFA85192.1 DUF254 family protein [Heterostelium album PN500]|eukprot:XP_020437301.1 DUF254 family protein [Heterostelium album PN500]